MSTSNKSLFQVLSGMRYFGVGSKVKRSVFRIPESYWIVTRVDLSPDQFHGNVYGKLVWAGVPRPKEELIRSPLKKQWSLIEFPDYTKFQGTASDIQKLIPTAKPINPKSK